MRSNANRDFMASDMVFPPDRSLSYSTPIISKLILLATGSHPSGRKIAKELGHNIVFPVPSLFSFRLANIPITSCSGLALDDIKLKLITTKKKFIEKGRVLITHCGFSGPVVLKLSAFAARNLHLDNYKAKLIINWLDLEPEDIKSIFMSIRDHKGFKSLVSLKPFPSLPKSLWINFLEQSNILPSVRWADLKSIDINYLIRALTQNEYLIQSRGPYGEEFVTAGGVDLRDINMYKPLSSYC